MAFIKQVLGNETVTAKINFWSMKMFQIMIMLTCTLSVQDLFVYWPKSHRFHARA